MSDRDQLVFETMRVFEPIIDLLSSLGVTAKDGQRILQQVWVRRVYEAEMRRARAAGRTRVSDARIAMLTSVPRAVVAEILGTTDVGVQTTHRAVRVLDAWYTDPRYSEDGAPLPLKLGEAGRRGVSFWSLVNSVAPDTWPGTVLKDLLMQGAVVLRDGHYVATRRDYAAGSAELTTLRQLGDICASLVATLVHNARVPEARRRTVRTVASDHVPVDLAKRVRRQLKEATDQFASRVRRDLKSVPAESDNTKLRTRMGITVFTIEEQSADAAELASHPQDTRDAKSRRPGADS
jgi:hypothetical protein